MQNLSKQSLLSTPNSDRMQYRWYRYVEVKNAMVATRFDGINPGAKCPQNLFPKEVVDLIDPRRKEDDGKLGLFALFLGESIPRFSL